MFYGQFVSGSVYLTTDGSGLPIHEAAEPTPGAGYHTALSYEQHDGAICSFKYRGLNIHFRPPGV